MSQAPFDFSATENKHFSSLATCCVISALALLLYALVDLAFVFNVIASGKLSLIVRTLDDLFLILASLYAAFRLRQAARCFRKIVNTQGEDIRLLNQSNQNLNNVFISLTVVLVSLAIRFILDYPALMQWIQAS